MPRAASREKGKPATPTNADALMGVTGGLPDGTV